MMKSLTGNQMNRLVFFLSIALMSPIAFAEISLPSPGVPLNSPSVIEDSKPQKKSPYLIDEISEYNMEEGTSENPYLPQTDETKKETELNKKITIREEIKGLGITIPGSYENKKNYYDLSNEEVLKKFEREGDSAFSFYYIQDNYDVTDGRNIFERTFGDGEEGAIRGGSLHFSFERFWLNGNFFLGWGMNFGVGLSKGKGNFVSNANTIEEKSQTKFTLWTIPVDLGLVAELPITRWFKVGLSGGPSVMGLYQHRDDKENREGGKHIKQVSVGYFGRANLKLSLSHFMPRKAILNFKEYGMTKFYLTLEGRYQNFSRFRDDVAITGSSFGLGFAFEYL